MLSVSVFSCGVLILCWTRLCVAVHVFHTQELIQDPTATGDPHTVRCTETGCGLDIKNALMRSSSASATSRHYLHRSPCFVDDMLATLREGMGDDSELANGSLSLFGACTSPGNSSNSVLLELAQETSRTGRNGFKIMHPTGELVEEEDERGMIKLTLDLPQSPLLRMKPVLLLMFESPIKGGDLHVTFTSQSLQPETQSVCISGETRYIVLPGKASRINIQQKWTITVEAKSPDMKQNLKDNLIGGKSGSNISMSTLLLFSGETGTSKSYAHASHSSSASSQTFSFLCELKRLLGDLLPQDQPETSPFQLDSLQSLPSLTIGLSSSETLLAGLINSSAPTVFSFTRWRSTFHVHHGELSLSPALLEDLRQRLQQTVTQIQSIIREEDMGDRATDRLGRLKDLSAFPKKEPAAGERQYRAFLLLKALQTVARAYKLQRGLRSTRADPSSPVRGDICRLRSLTVFLEKHVIGPSTANINNCHGSCRFPMANIKNHAVLLSSHIESGDVDERPLCCVPVAYEELEVVDFNEHGTYLSIKPDVVAKECECR